MTKEQLEAVVKHLQTELRHLRGDADNLSAWDVRVIAEDMLQVISTGRVPDA